MYPLPIASCPHSPQNLPTLDKRDISLAMDFKLFEVSVHVYHNNVLCPVKGVADDAICLGKTVPHVRSLAIVALYPDSLPGEKSINFACAYYDWWTMNL